MKDSQEIWKSLVGYEANYEVSNTGLIRNKKTDKILKSQIDRCGYERVRLSVNNKKSSVRLHRAVALTFIPNPHLKEQVNHIDGIKINNYVDNLEWCTNSENQEHANRIGLRVTPTGRDSARYESPVKVFDLDGKYLYTLHGNKEMAEKGFDYRNVSAVVLGKRKTYKGHKFKR